MKRTSKIHEKRNVNNDSEKNKSNTQKTLISFEERKLAYDLARARIFEDVEKSLGESSKSTTQENNNKKNSNETANTNNKTNNGGTNTTKNKKSLTSPSIHSNNKNQKSKQLDSDDSKIYNRSLVKPLVNSTTNANCSSFPNFVIPNKINQPSQFQKNQTKQKIFQSQQQLQLQKTIPNAFNKNINNNAIGMDTQENSYNSYIISNNDFSKNNINNSININNPRMKMVNNNGKSYLNRPISSVLPIQENPNKQIIATTNPINQMAYPLNMPINSRNPNQDKRASFINQSQNIQSQLVQMPFQKNNNQNLNFSSNLPVYMVYDEWSPKSQDLSKKINTPGKIEKKYIYMYNYEISKTT